MEALRRTEPSTPRDVEAVHARIVAGARPSGPENGGADGGPDHESGIGAPGRGGRGDDALDDYGAESALPRTGFAGPLDDRLDDRDETESRGSDGGEADGGGLKPFGGELAGAAVPRAR